jgi:histidine kinase/DNA gyrase B/HSP90-like ATPase
MAGPTNLGAAGLWIRSRDGLAGAGAIMFFVGGLVILRLGFGPFDLTAGLLAVLTGWLVGVAGLVAWLSLPSGRSGLLLVAVAGAWGVANLTRTPYPMLSTVAAALQLLYAPMLGHAIVALPGRRRSVVAAGATGLAYLASFLAPPAGPIVVSILLALSCGSTALVRLADRSFPFSPSAFGVVFALTLGGMTAFRWFAPGGFALDSRPAVEVSLVVTATALAAAAASFGERRRKVTDLVVDLGQEPHGDLTARLAEAIGDPTLEVVYALGEGGGYVDAAGRPVLVPPANGGRAVTPIERNGRPVAAIIHDPATAALIDLPTAIAAAAELSGVNARLQADVDRRAKEVSASRRRLLGAADDERRALRAQLDHDLGPRLDALQGILGNAPTAGDRRMVSAAVDQVVATRTETEALAEGLYPRLVEELGLAGAVQDLASRSTLPLKVWMESGVHGALPSEAAMYFVCSEALANALKHAGATSVSVRLGTSTNNLVVEIEDDGVGGADPGRGTGLAGLRERLEALGGSLQVSNRVGHGTRIVASVPTGVTIRS